MSERMNDSYRASQRDKPFTCALCGKATRSVYSLPGERGALMCGQCFFHAGNDAAVPRGRMAAPKSSPDSSQGGSMNGEG